MSDNEITEVAKATQEVAKTASNAIDGAREFSNFLSQVFGDALVNLGEIARYKTEYWKIKNGLVLKEKVKQLLDQRGIVETEEVGLRLGVPLLEAAVNEDDDGLQAIWAGLLASAMDPRSSAFVRKSFIEVAKQLDPNDAKVLSGIHHMFISVVASEQRHWMSWGNFDEQTRWWISIRNLERLGLIRLLKEKKDGSFEFDFLLKQQVENNGIKAHIELTSYGYGFVRTASGLALMPEGEKGELLLVDSDEYLHTVNWSQKQLEEWEQ